MAWASDAWGSGAWGGSGDADVASAPTLAEILAAEHQVFAVVITLPLLAGGSTTIYWSDRYYASKASDDPASTEFEPVIIGLEDEAAVNISPLTQADNSIAGRVRVQDIDGAIEALFDSADYAKRTIDIWVGRSAGKPWADDGDDPFAWFQRIGKFSIEDISSDGEVLDLSYRDRTYELDVPAQETRYAGTGTYEGGPALLDEPKPLLGGWPSYVEPRLIDPTYLIYQYHDGATSVGPLLDGGVALTSDGTSTNLYGETIAAGHYRLDETRGMFRLGATPAVQIMAESAIGLSVTRVPLGSSTPIPLYTHADVARALIERRIPSFPIDTAAFSDLGDALAYVDPGTGYAYYPSCQLRVEQGDTLRQLLDRLMAACGGYYQVGYDGILRTGRLSVPVAADIAAEFDVNNILSVTREKLPQSLWPPPYAIEMMFRRNFDAQQSRILAAGASATARQAVQKEQQTLLVKDDDISAAYENAILWRKFDGMDFWGNQTLEQVGRHYLDVHAGNADDGTIFKRLFLHLRVPKTALALQPYSTIKITWPRYGLDTGKLFVAWPAGRNMVVDGEPTTVDLLAWGGFEP